jgi:hypothetical protein
VVGRYVVFDTQEEILAQCTPAELVPSLTKFVDCTTGTITGPFSTACTPQNLKVLAALLVVYAEHHGVDPAIPTEAEYARAIVYFKQKPALLDKDWLVLRQPGQDPTAHHLVGKF